VLRIYVGNLNYRTTDQSLADLFNEHGEVSTASVITDRQTGRSRGFGFVEMPDEGQGKAAIEALNGQEFEGRMLTVNEARPRAARPSGGGGNW